MSAVHKASSGGTLATRRFVHAVAHLALAIQAILAFPALAPAQSPIGDGGWTLAFDHDSITTDSTAAFTQNQHQIQFWNGTIGGATQTWGFPSSFNSAHMALIPRGPHRGCVIVWNTVPVIALATSIDPNVVWSFQAWSIVDPSPNPAGPRCRNFLLPMEPVIMTPTGPLVSDIFCAGHTWSPNGDLVVAGGTRHDAQAGHHAADRTFIFNPALATGFSRDVGGQLVYTPLNGGHYGGASGGGSYGLWVEGPRLTSVRYYPTLLLTHEMSPRLAGQSAALVLGGSDPSNLASTAGNTYEALVINGASSTFFSGLSKDIHQGQSQWIGAGTLGIGLDYLGEYPRAHLLSNGSVFVSGFGAFSAHLIDHDATPGAWYTGIGHTTITGNWNQARVYGSSVLFPNVGALSDVILRVGGHSLNGTPTNTCEYISALVNSPPAQWSPTPSQLGTTNPPQNERTTINTVLLPDASLMVFGGAGPGGVAYRNPLLMKQGASLSWQELTWAPAATDRTYHSSAILLEDGRVLVAGGEGSEPGFDYEVFTPHYLLRAPTTPPAVNLPIIPQNVRLVNMSVNPQFGHGAYDISYGQTYSLECDPLPFGTSIEKVVLMAPGSVTHHSDMAQRYHEVDGKPKSPNRFGFTAPAGSKDVPRGFYMMFALTNAGVPARAIWVKL